MRRALRYRLFKMGKMPESLAAVAAGDGVRTASGAIVILPGRLLASIGSYVIVDTDFHPSGGKQTLELSNDGVGIKLDVSSVLASGSGTVEVH